MDNALAGQGAGGEGAGSQLVPFQLDESRSKLCFERDEPHHTGESVRAVPAGPHGRPSAEIVGTALAKTLQDKLKQVHAILGACEHVIVAFSGGVDSTVLAKVARDRLGKAKALIVTADSPSLAREDFAVACRLARELDFQHLVIETKEVSNPSYRENSPSRCYVCKYELFETLQELAERRHIAVILYGAIGDDVLAERPGQRAARAWGVRAPLQEAGLSKWEVRKLARHLGLPNWDRPQNACLSSRIPHGQAVTEETLRQVEAAEGFLRARGFRQIRVRHLGSHARIEVGRDEIARFQDIELCAELTKEFATIGFTRVSVDRGGYHAGGANAIPVDELVLTLAHDC